MIDANNYLPKQSLELIENIFNLDDTVTISNNRNKEDILEVGPILGKTFEGSGIKTFEVNNQQHFLNFSEAYFNGEVELTLTGGDDKITLENNWFPRCFSQMILNIGGKEIEGIHEAVGEASTIVNFIMSTDIYRKTYGQLSGWFPDTNKGDNDIDNIDYNEGFIKD